MKTKITSFELDNELDIVMAHKKAVQLSQLAGFTISDQTRFATAVAEISRNCIEHAKKGIVFYFIKKEDNNLILEAEIKDCGPGINDLKQILNKKDVDVRFKGAGIASSRKLVDFFQIKSSKKGTCVHLGKQIPVKHPPINKTILEGWKNHFSKDVAISPYEEIKNRNIQLLDLADRLKEKHLEAELQVEEIKKLNDILHRKNENLKQIAYSIAHDLKNPLSTINLACEMGMDPENIGDTGNFFKMIQKNSDRLAGIIGELQKTIDHDPDISITADQVDLNDLIKDMYEQFSPYLDIIHGNLKFDFSTQIIKYPKVYLYSILGNLISNSIKYMSTRELEMNVTGRKKRNFFLLTVADNGIGIDLEKHGKKLFKPFSRFTEQGEGKGMGLNIVHHIVTKNGGDIKIESKPGEWTKIHCYLKEY